MTTYEIPLTADAQTFAIDLAGKTYNLTLRWNAFAAAWTLDIADSAKNVLIAGIPLVVSTDLLSQFAYMNFGGKLTAMSDNAIDTPPNYSGLGTIGHLFFTTTP